jgi:hypothetical protein
MTWLQAFALTQLLEVPVFLLGMRSAPLSAPLRLAVALGASALTHPVVWFVLPPLLGPRLGWWGYFAVAETFAVLAEWRYLAAFEVERPLRLSLAANGLSMTVGLVVTTAW